MKAPQQWRLEYGVAQSFEESGRNAACERKSDSDSPIKAFLEAIPQVDDPILTMLRFQAFLKGWDSTLAYDAGETLHVAWNAQLYGIRVFEDEVVFCPPTFTDAPTGVRPDEIVLAGAWNLNAIIAMLDRYEKNIQK